NDGGFLWRLYSYWRFEEKAGGVFVQCEAISLTRGIPKLLAWLIKPFVTGIPRESLLNTLGSTRKALTAAPQTRTSPEGGTRSDWMPDAAEPAQPAFPRGLHSSHALARLRPLRPGS
ncbi:MAG: hypothetical protein ACRD24_11550, partial [Terriglobales bacterium]